MQPNTQTHTHTYAYYLICDSTLFWSKSRVEWLLAEVSAIRRHNNECYPAQEGTSKMYAYLDVFRQAPCLEW